MLIVFSGLPGTGKSTLAQGLAHRSGLPVFSVDPIEAAMLRAGIGQSRETGLAAYLIVEVLADARLTLGQGAIVDAVNAVAAAKAMWRDLARKHGAPLKIIECRCSDTALHEARVRKRRRGFAELLPEPTWQQVERRQAEYVPWADPLLDVDATASPESNLARVLAWLELDSAGARS